MSDRDQWFRSRRWSPDIEQEFFARLSRSRGVYHKAQYLRIQANSLAVGKRNAHIALRLLDKLFTEVPDPSQLECAHLTAAKCHERLENFEGALRHYRLALRAHRQYPNSDCGARRAFPVFVVRHQATELYAEALRVLDRSKQVFAAAAFEITAVRALIAAHQRQRRIARDQAEAALAFAGIKRSQFRYHPRAGLVGSRYADLIERLMPLVRLKS